MTNIEKQTEYKFKYQSPLALLPIAILCAFGAIVVLLIGEFIGQHSLLTGIVIRIILGLAFLILITKINDKFFIFDGTGVLLKDAIEITTKFSKKHLPLSKITDVRWAKSYKRNAASLIIVAGWGGCDIACTSEDDEGYYGEKSPLYKFYIAAKIHYDKRT